MEGRFSMTKLNNTNYNSWRFKVELLLVREELWQYVDPGVKPEAVVQASWDAGVAKARATIGLLIEDNQHALIRSSKTAREAWLSLQSHHRKTTLSSKVSLLKRICDKRFAEGDDMAEHLYSMEELFDQLLNAGQELAENLRVAMILRSLPSSFDTLTTALETRADADLTMELVKRKLLDEVDKRQESGTDSVLKVGTAHRREKQKKPLQCYQCNKTGHKKQNCPELSRPSNSSSRRDEPQRKKSDTVSFAFAGVSESQNDVKPWVVDSGASSHTVADRAHFSELRACEVKWVKLADGKHAPVEGRGTVTVTLCDEKGQPRKVQLSNALYTPSLAMNLLSVSEIAKKGATVMFTDKVGCRITKGKATVASARLMNGLYILEQPQAAVLAINSHLKKNCEHMWHRRFGHRDDRAIDRLNKENLATGCKMFKCGMDVNCETCLKSKSTRIPFPKKSTTSSSAPMDLIHTDVCGPVETPSVSGYRYFMTMIDDHSRYCVLYLLKRKSEVASKIEEYVAMATNMFGRKPKIIRSDQGGEYRGQKLKEFYRRQGIQPQFTAGYSPQQNGVAERKNRYLVEMVRCLLSDANMPQRYWPEASNTAVYLQNILPTKGAKLSPFELWHKVKPDVKHLRVFGCSAWVHVPKEKRKKLSDTAKQLTFVGYSLEHKAYRFLDQKTQQITISRDAQFEEDVCCPTGKEETGTSKEYIGDDVLIESPLKKPTSCPETTPEENDESDDDTFDSANSEDDASKESEGEVAVRKVDHSSEPNIPPQRTNPADSENLPRRSERSTKGIGPERYSNVTGSLKIDASEPRCYSEATQCTDKNAWHLAMEEEMNSLRENQTWELTPLPPGRKAIGCKWTYKMKENEKGEVVRYKARLVAQGFSQRYGTDYDEVFAPVVKQTTLRTLLTTASHKSMVVKHLDIKSAYLYANLDEEIYMKQPPGFQSGNDLVCRLKRSIYGLKQSARIWNKKIDDVFKKMRFTPGKADSCLYVRDQGETKCFIVIYVDDMVVFCNSEKEFNEIEDGLANHFKLSELGDLKHFLGINIDKVDGHYSMCQKAYIDKIVARFGHEDAKPSKIPIDPSYIKQKEEKLLETNTSYRSLVGSLLYVAVNTRPDISISTSLLCRKVANPTNRDWTEAKRVLRYLKGTKDLRLHLGSGVGLECFADADWAGNEGDRKSFSGFLIKYGGGLVSWGSRKQTCVSLSSTEAEFVALSVCCQELMWTKKLLADLGEKDPGCVVVWEDNQSCIKMVESDRIDNRSKHIDTKHAFTKDLRHRGVINLQYLSTEQMEADIMTKPLARVKLERHREAIGLQ